MTPIRLFFCLVGVVVVWFRLKLIGFSLGKYRRQKQDIFRVRRGLPHALDIWELIKSRCKHFRRAAVRSIRTVLIKPFRVLRNARPKLIPLLAIVRGVLFFAFGLLLGWLVFFFIEFQKKPRLVSQLVPVVALLFNSFGIAFSSRIRCITCVAVPQLLAGRGRYVLLICISYLIIQGPLLNILLNGEKLASSFLCLSRIAFLNFQMSVRKAAEPLVDLIQTIKGMLAQLKEMTKQMLFLLQMLEMIVVVVQFWLGKLCCKRG